MKDAPKVGKTKIGTRYQAVISAPVREIATEIEPGKEATVIPLDSRSVLISVKPESWTKATLGMDKKSWKGIDVKRYLKELRAADENRKI